MSKPEHFEIADDHAIFRPTGQVSLEQAVQLVTSAITFAREQHFRKLLVITTDLRGFKPPDLATRYVFIRAWARAAEGYVCIAVVARPEMIDSEKFGVTVAANSGLVGDVFESEEKALVWLRSLK